nr:hypothetical protein [uncultured Niameybacter sp.]
MKKLIVFFGGLFILHFGVALLLELNLGSDPFTVFTQGLATILGITPGGANRIITLVLLIILLIFSRKSIQIGCFLCLLFTGVFLDLNLWIIGPLQLGSLSFIGRLIGFMVACIIIGIGFPLLKCADLGVAPNDLVYLVLSEKLNKSYRVVRMSVDFICAIAGFLLGGVLGLGTVLCVLFIGPVIQFFFDKVERIANKFLKEVHIT